MLHLRSALLVVVLHCQAGDAVAARAVLGQGYVLASARNVPAVLSAVQGQGVDAGDAQALQGMIVRHAKRVAAQMHG